MPPRSQLRLGHATLARIVASCVAVHVGALATPVRAAQPTPVAGYPRPPGEAERIAEQRLGEHTTFKPGKGLTFASTEGRFSLTFNFGLQFLYTFLDRRPPPVGEERTTNSFEIRRARVIFSGNVFSKHVLYYTQLQFSPRDLGLADGQIRQSPLFMGWAAFDRIRDFVPQIGFFFVPYSRQRVQPVLKLNFIDFSLASSEFGLERDIGIDLGSKDLGGIGKLRYHVGAYLGEGTDFAKASDAGFTYVGRFEVLPMGDFDDYIDADLARRKQPKLALGFGYAFAHGDRRNRAINGAPFTDGGYTDAHNATADLMFKVAGVAVLADVWFRHGKRNYGNATITDEDGNTSPAPREAPRNGIGWTAQAGWLIPRAPVEIAGRYSGVRSIGSDTSLTDANEAGPALSYYFAEHAVKLQLDHAHGWAQGGTQSDRIRLQLQVGF